MKLPLKKLIDVSEIFKTGRCGSRCFVPRRCAAWIIVIICLCSCSRTQTVYVPTETVRTEHLSDTLRQTLTLRDSVYLRDSIFVEGETVYKERLRYQYITRHDTVYKVKTDTVAQLREVTKMIEVPKTLSWWQRVRIAIGNIFLIVLAILLTFKLMRN